MATLFSTMEQCSRRPTDFIEFKGTRYGVCAQHNPERQAAKDAARHKAAAEEAARRSAAQHEYLIREGLRRAATEQLQAELDRRRMP
jgi:hypothetical protein